MKQILLALILSTSFFGVTSHPLNLAKSEVKTIVIDAGHGGKDPGCIGYAQKSYEKDVALDIALKLGKIISYKMPNVKVIYTRKDDRFIPLWERAAIANRNNADLFISVHCNANDSEVPHGTETYVMGLHKTNANLAVSKRENASIIMEDNYENNEEYNGFDPSSDEAHIILSLYQNAYRNQSLQLAGNFQTQIERKKVRKNLGVKEAGFLVLWKTAMPSILVETGFLTNPDDHTFLNTSKGRLNIAHSIMDAISDYKNQLED